MTVSSGREAEVAAEAARQEAQTGKTEQDLQELLAVKQQLEGELAAARGQVATLEGRLQDALTSGNSTQQQLDAIVQELREEKDPNRSIPESSGWLGEISATPSANWGINMIHNNPPDTLNMICTTAARTASRGFPIDANRAVTQVPILAPNASAIPAGKVMNPWLAMTITIPVVADDDCTSAVNTAAISIPMSGFSIFTMRSRKGWYSRNGYIPSLIMLIPKKTRPRPMVMPPI